jgi:hypothetical protein
LDTLQPWHFVWIELSEISRQNIARLHLIEIALATAAIAHAQSGPDVGMIIARARNSGLTLRDFHKKEGGKLLRDRYRYQF